MSFLIGGSSSFTINSQGNQYIAPFDTFFDKEVTKRVDTEEEKWRNWNWRSEGDVIEFKSKMRKHTVWSPNLLIFLLPAYNECWWTYSLRQQEW